MTIALRSRFGLFSCVTLLCLSQWVTVSPAQIAPKPTPSSLREGNATNLSRRPSEIYARLPLHFIPHEGQLDKGIRFLVEARNQSLAFTDAGVEIFLGSGTGEQARTATLQMRFSGARRGVRVRGGELAEGKINYLLGSDPSRWRPGLPAYKELIYRGLYPNVDLSYVGRGDQLESIFTVKPGGRVNDIRVHCSGASFLKVDREGNLTVGTAAGQVRKSKPLAFQFVQGVRREIPIRFRVEAGSKTYGFQVDSAYDPREPLVIDPILGFASYLGGSGEDDGTAIAVDGTGQIYITGFTISTNFPTQTPYQAAAAGKGDVFVTKVAADGSSLIYSTYLGGLERDVGSAIVINASGQAHITGLTLSDNFPTVSAYRSTHAGKGDAFVAKLAANGQSLVYSTYLGGADLDFASGISLESGGAVYLCGQTFSSDFPVQNAFQVNLRGIQDAFAAKLSSSGQSLEYSTLLGGSGGEGANGIAVDNLGQAHLTGFTTSINFPTQSALRTANSGNTDAFVTKLGASGNTLVYSTYLGGNDDDFGNALLVDSSGTAYITGSTRSSDFPTASAYQSTNKGGLDGFLTRLSAAGNTLTSSTYLGGTGEDEGFAVARDSAGLIYVAGTTSSTNFPIANPLRSSLLGDTDAFLTEFASGAQALVFSTYLGGSLGDSAAGMVVDSGAKIYITGFTRSNDFPLVAPRQPSFGGGTTDAFYLQIDPTEPVFATTLYFPRLVTNDGVGGTLDSSEFTGIGVANLSASSANLRFTALDTTGTFIGGAGIVNPTQLTLAAKNQLATIDTQVFGTGLAAKKPVGWFKMGSSVAEVVGFFLAFNSSLTVLDGADVSARSATSFVLPEVEDLGFTQVHIANPDISSAAVTLELVDGGGTVRATATRTVAVNGVLVETSAQLFPAVTAFSGSMYVRVTSTRPVIAFEYLGKTGQYVEGLNGQDTTQGARTVYSPQYVVGGPWRTTLSIVNFENTAAVVTLELIGDNGAVLASGRENLTARGKSQITAQNYFVTPNPAGTTQGYVRLVSDRNIGGAVIFGDPARNTFSAALPLVSKLQTSSIFSHVASDSIYFTGLAVLNPGDVDTTFTLDVFDKTGTMVATKSVAVAAKRRVSQLLTQYFPTLPNMSSGYFRASSTQGLVSFALFGTNTLSVLSAVPPQAVP